MTSLKQEEVDAWWGSYSIKCILPGLLAALAASGLVVGAAWLFAQGTLEQLIVMGLQGLSWLALALYWINLVFGVNYRLTTYRLFVGTGLSRRRLRAVPLAKVVRVVVHTARLEKLLGVGRLSLEVQDLTAPVVLKGVAAAAQVAELIRDLSAKARK